jgi:EAL domain-containing protein (putative c-di-GMP-specific phosphodiesterase class I)
VHATIRLAHTIGMSVVAEGVEDEATWELLATERCDLIQGYALSKPLPAAELDSLLHAKSPHGRVPSTSTPPTTVEADAAGPISSRRA